MSTFPFYPVTPAQAQADPTGVPRTVAPGALERSRENSGVIVGESRTSTSTGDDTYKTEFVKVYQDAGVVGVAMLTLLVLCLLLGLFCSRLIKMYTALTESRDTLEAARTAAIEKLSTSLILLRSETSTVIAELRREHDTHAIQINSLISGVDRMADRVEDCADAVRGIDRGPRPTGRGTRAARPALPGPDEGGHP